ncbi:hypothetical protein [Rhizobium sp. Root483D2]|uniref:hypothetical protein n=1 Tax=Rhizobium sp. Root483D2 TaxID=1736545 RepID=UPI000713560B|nr:hypothetical protein [Rhizobium sp. Root483D2]KQY21028.1 hypothetical protein ASD32_06515 [Rhizobium sp. Root483D2]
MPTDEERLVVSLEARVNDFEKKWKQAERTGTNVFTGLRRSSKTATQQMEDDAVRSTTRINQALATVGTKVGNFGKAFAGGLAAGVVGMGVAGIISQIQQVAKGVAQIGDEAKRAGLSIQAFQELKFVAEQNRIGVDSLVDGIKELNLRADEFISTGAGSAAEAFGRLGYGADELKTKLKDPSELFTEIIGKLQQLDRAAQIRIADELFGGTGGEKFVQLIEQGEKGIRATIRQAHTLGTVMSDELVTRADELDKKFNAITTSVGTGLKTAIVAAATELQNFISSFQGFMAEYEKRKRTAENGAAMGGMLGKPFEQSGANTTGKTSRLPATPTTLPSQEQLSTKYLENYRAELALTNQQRAIAAESETILANAASQGLKVTKEQAEALAREKVARDEGEASTKKQGASREKAGSQADTERQQIRDLIADLEEELRIVNLSDVAKRASIASRQAGAAATEEERQRIIDLSEALYQEEEARQRQVDAMEFGRDLTRGAIDDLTAGLENNKSLWESLGDAGVNSLKRIADTMIDDVLDSIFKVNNAAGGGGGIFGALLSGLGSFFGGGKSASPGFLDNGFDTGLPKFAKGGIAAGPSIFGEAGPEAAVPLPDGRRIPVDMGSKGGGGQSVHVTSDVKVSVDENGNLKAYVTKTATQISERKVSDGLQHYDRSVLPNSFHRIRVNPRNRG